MKVPNVLQYDKFKIAPKRFQTALTHGKKRIVGNQRSFSERATLRTWEPNIHYVKLYSESLDKRLSLKATSHVLRCVDKAGGLDSYLLNSRPEKLETKLALWLRDKIFKQKQLNGEKQQVEEAKNWHAQALAEHLMQEPQLVESVEKQSEQQQQQLAEQDLPLYTLQQEEASKQAKRERFWQMRTRRKTGKYKRSPYKEKSYFLQNQIPEQAWQTIQEQSKQTKERVDKYVARMAKKASAIANTKQKE